jgi:hypothetical protein
MPATLITHAAFLLAHPGLWNVSIVLVADLALIVRALLEERVLTQDRSIAATALA